jgi:hypothetical protein
MKPALLALALLLAACGRQPTADKPTGPPSVALLLAPGMPPSSAFAPTAMALPVPAAPIVLRPEPPNQHFRDVDRAYAMSDALDDVPPDYTVALGDTAPWVWQAGNGALRLVERLADGERYYFYAPNARQPYLVATSAYVYAYDNGALIGVYDNGGAPLPDATAAQRRDEAGRYYARGTALHAAVVTGRHHPAYAADWRARRESIAQQLDIWREAALLQRDWQAWHNAHAAEQAPWVAERRDRLAHAAAIDVNGAALVTAAPSPAQPEPVPPLESSSAEAAEPARTAATPSPATRAAPVARAKKPVATRARLKPKARVHPRKAPAVQSRVEVQTEPPAAATPEARPARKKRTVTDKVGDFFDRTFGGRREGR